MAEGSATAATQNAAPASAPGAAPRDMMAATTTVLTAAANLVGLDQELPRRDTPEVAVSDDTLKVDDDNDDDEDDNESSDEVMGDSLGSTDETASRHTGAKALFLQKLYDILENEENKDYICWCGNGERVLIKDHAGLSNVVLPQYYNHANFKSFVRQLHMYSFRKLQVDSESDWSVFQQPRFKRGQRQLLKTIKRKTSTISGGHNGRLLTPKISTLLKDISDMRHELHTNSSRLALMETNLHAIAMRCEHLEHELHGRRALAPAAALQPDMPAGVGRGPDGGMAAYGGTPLYPAPAGMPPGMQFGNDDLPPHFKFLNAVQGGQMRDPAAVGMPVQGSFQQGFTIGNPYVVGAMHGGQPQMYNPSLVGAPGASGISRSMPPPVPMRSMAALQMSQMSQHLAPNMPGMPPAPNPAAMMAGAPKPHATPNVALAAGDSAAMNGTQQFAAPPPWQNGAQEARPTQPEAPQEEMAS